MKRRYPKAPIVFGVVLLLAMSAIADWPVEIRGPNALTYPVIGSDDNGGAFIGGSAPTANGFNVCLFRVTADGDLSWDSVIYSLPDEQHPLEIKSDGYNGCLVLLEDWPGFPPVRNRLILLRYNEDGGLMWETMVDDSLPGSRLYPSLTVAGNQAVVAWFDGSTESEKILYQRFCIAYGTPLDERGRYLADAFFHDVAVIGDSLLIAAGDSLYLVSLVDGLVVSARSGAPLGFVQVLSLDNIVLVAGWQSQGINGNVLLEYFSDTSLMCTDTMATEVTLPVELEILPDKNNGASITYNGNFDLFFRSWSPGNGLSEEMIICDDPSCQFAYQSSVADSAIVMAWYDERDERNGRNVYIQQVKDGQIRWPNGLKVGSVSSPSPTPPIDVCAGGGFGWMVWDSAGYFYVQPVDSPTNVGVPKPRPSLPCQFKLFTPYPNPCNGAVRIEFELVQKAVVTLTVYNEIGQKVATLIDHEWQSVGIHKVSWTPTKVASGVYFVRLGNGSNLTAARRLVIIR